MPSSGNGQSWITSLWLKLIASPSAPRIGVAVGCFILILAVTIGHIANPSSAIQLGDVARQDYQAPYSTNYTDTLATLEARNEAAAEVSQVYTPNNQINAKITQDYGNFFLRLDELATQFEMMQLVEQDQTEDAADVEEEETPAAETPEEPSVDEVDIARFEEIATVELVEILEDSLVIQRYLIDPVIEQDMLELLRMSSIARENVRNLVDRAVRERIVGLIFTDNLPETLEDLRDTIMDKAESDDTGQDAARLASKIAGYYIRPNAVLDEEATELARQQARDATPPVQNQVRDGEIFLRAGEVVDQEDLDIMRELGMTTEPRRGAAWPAIVLFALMLGAAFVLGSIYLAGRTIPQIYDMRFYLLFYTIVTITYLSSFLLIQTFNERALLTLAALPVIAGTVLLSHYFTRMLSVTVSGFLAVIVTLAAGEPAVLLPALFPSLAAGLLVKRDCPKPLMIRATVLLPLIWLISLLAMAYTSNIDLTPFQVNPWYLLAGLAPAPVAMFLANYVLDAAFNAPTTSRLQEFDNQDHPLLRKLQLEAPGTWHHSMMLGLIAEAACQAVGGNAHLVRIACMYHDIGKTRRPEFFIENQHGSMNVHDKYSPWLSKIIVEGHVKDGIALAKAHGLPKELIDIIPQHHGTTLITYFFRKALAMSEDGYVNEYDYRYPGPKPQTLEAACINIADAAESAVRSLEEPTPHRIESMVNKVYEDRLLDGQYDECGLALNQLEIIKQTIIDRLVGSYHARIEYPEEEELRRQLQLKRAEAEKSQKKEAAQVDQE